MDWKQIWKDVTSVLLEAKDRIIPPQPLTQEQIKDKIAEKVDGKELTHSYCWTLFGEKEGENFYKKLNDVKRRFHEKFPEDNFPPVFISYNHVFPNSSAGYLCNALLKKDKNNKLDATDTYEAIVVGREFLLNKTPDEILATICHEAGHDGKNHSNQHQVMRNQKLKYLWKLLKCMNVKRIW